MPAPLETLALLRLLAQAFPSVSLEEATLRLYAAKLADVPAPELAHCIDRAIEQCRWFPSICELRAIRDGLRPSPGPKGAPSQAAYLEDGDLARFRREQELELAVPPPAIRGLLARLSGRKDPALAVQNYASDDTPFREPGSEGDI